METLPTCRVQVWVKIWETVHVRSAHVGWFCSNPGWIGIDNVDDMEDLAGKHHMCVCIRK